jgi:O-antigen/teichoic acid export membrane protein
LIESTCQYFVVADTDSPDLHGGRGAEFRGKRAATNSAVMYGGQIAIVLIALVTTRVAFHDLGLIEFGVWTAAGGAITLLTLVDPGFSDLVTRYGARGRVQGDPHLGARVAALGTIVWLVFGAICAPVVWVLMPQLVHLVHRSTGHLLSPSIQHAAIVYLYWSLGFLVFGSIQATISGRLIGIGDQWLVTIIDVATRVVYGVVLIELLHRGWRLNGIIAAQAVQMVLVLATTIIAIAMREGPPLANPQGIDRALRRELFRFGGWLQLNSVLDTLTYETDPIVLALGIGAAASGIWGVAQRLSRQSTYWAGVPQANVLPALSASHAAGEGTVSLQRIFVRAQRIVVGVGILIGGSIVAFGPLMFAFWLGKPLHYASTATIIVALTMIAGLPRAVTANATLAMGRVGLGVRPQVLAFLVNLVLTAAFVVPFGLIGVLVGTLVAKVVASGYFLLRFARVAGGSLRQLVGSWAVPLVGVTAVTATGFRFVMAGWGSAQHSEGLSFVALVALGLAYTAVTVAGLRLVHFFSRSDLIWLRDAAPGPTGKLLGPRVINLLAGSRS